NVFLSICGGESITVRIYNAMHSDADPRGLGYVFDQIHLLAVVVHSINPVALTPDGVQQPVRLDIGRKAINQNVIAALRGIDELKGLPWSRRRVGPEMMGDWTGIPVVPVFDPCERFSGSQVLSMRSSPKLCGGQVHIVAENSESETRGAGHRRVAQRRDVHL